MSDSFLCVCCVSVGYTRSFILHVKIRWFKKERKKERKVIQNQVFLRLTSVTVVNFNVLVILALSISFQNDIIIFLSFCQVSFPGPEISMAKHKLSHIVWPQVGMENVTVSFFLFFSKEQEEVDLFNLQCCLALGRGKKR